MVIILKKFICVFITILLCFWVTAFSYEKVDVYVNNNKIVSEAPPLKVNARVLLPLRDLLKNINIPDNSLTWYENSDSIKIKYDDNFIFMSVGINNMIINDKVVFSDCPPLIINNKTYIPVRIVCEAFKADVLWDDVTKSVHVNLWFF